MSFEVLKKISKFRGKRTRERLKRTATYMLNPELQSVNGVTSRDKKSYSSSLKHPYPYIEEVRELIAPDADYLDEFCLVGESWSTNPEAPILPFFGCNDWKYGFLADYFPEYRVAFAPRKLSGFRASRVIDKFSDEIDAVAIWGCTESDYFRRYLNKKGISIWRVEDGFIRSAELGAAHSTPYSLAIDKSGIYYAPNSGSELEKILSAYDFESDPDLIEKAAFVRRAIIENRLSKYNPPCFKESGDIKVRKRIAVLGQVDSDASIKFGNPKGWSSLDLIKLAYQENPGAEIIYRPHPEVFRGFQKSSLKRKSVENFATICNPDTSFVDFIDSVDHCYTISSLSGFEALVRGKKVTVVGIPFYAGWGLTDDRAEVSHRERRLSIDEIFAGAYLLYPKYLADLNDPYNGLVAACSRIVADKDHLLYTSFKNAENTDLLKYSNSYLWPGALKKSRDNHKVALKFLKAFNIGSIISKNSEELEVRAFVFFCVGQLKDAKLIDQFLKSVRVHIEPRIFNRVLLTLSEWVPSDLIEKNINWLVANFERVDFAKVYFEKSYKSWENSSSQEESFEHEMVIDYEVLDDNLKHMIALRNLSEAQSIAEMLLLSGNNEIEALRSLVSICELSFSFRSSLLVSQMINGLDPLFANRFGILSEFRARKNIGSPNLLSLEWLSKFLTLKPDQVIGARFALESMLGSEESDEIFRCLVAQCRLDRSLSYRKIQCYIQLEEFDRAEVDIKRLVLSGDKSDNARILLSQVLSYKGRIDEALNIMLPTIDVRPTTSNISEVLRLYILKCDYRSSMRIFEFASSKGVLVGEMHRRKLFFGNRMIEDAFSTFREVSIKQNLAKYYGSKYLDVSSADLTSAASFKSLCVVAIFGPGDEIRFASIYRDLRETLPRSVFLKITVTPRLSRLFERSFQGIEFVPTPRPRNSDFVDYDEYKDVPGSDLVGIVNDDAVSAIDSCDSVAMVSDFLASYRKSYVDFPGTSYLLADTSLKDKFLHRLPSGKLLVGISWRSSLATAGRNEHYLNVEQLSELFEVPGIQFVNLQYDECSEELARVEAKYPGKLIDFKDLDQYNDFDGVAALMSCLDLIISPATTVVELAGALGVKTWLFSNSSEIDWRKKDSKGTDVWHGSVTIVDVEKKGDKEALVREIKKRLEGFVSKNETISVETQCLVK